jgi:hypothetical protein
VDRPLTARVKPAHLVCRSGWALLLALVCSYFAYRIVAEIRLGDYEVQISWWKALTWGVWAVLAGGLMSEVRCWRERLLFGVLFVKLLLGCVFSLWASAPIALVREARWVSLALWCLAGLLSLVALVGRGSESDAGAANA